jgi:2-methylisocitrate lyase-like PEP mutase family enzyme
MQQPLPVTAPLVLNPLMARMVEAAGFAAGYLGGGATGYQKVSLEANLNLTEMCQAAVDIHAVSSLPLILDGAIAERLGGPLMYLTGCNGLAGLGMTLADLGALGFRIVADPSTPLLTAFAAWQKVYENLADGFGATGKAAPDWGPAEKAMLETIDLEKLLAVERATVEKGKR